MKLTKKAILLALQNLRALFDNSYFGRMVMMGLVPGENTVVIVTAISGRGDDTKNRIYNYNAITGRIFTEIADPTRPAGDPEMTLYDAQLEDHHRGIFVASNGRQTVDCLGSPKAPLDKLLNGWTYEPDRNSTPRISGRCLTVADIEPTFEFVIHRRTPEGKLEIEATKPEFLKPGFGLYMCTYEGNGDPLPSFIGGPRLIALSPSFEADLIRGLQSSNDFLVSVAVKRISLDNGETSISVWNRN